VPDPAVCVFDLDHTLVDSPLDLRAVGREMEAFVRARRIALPERELRWSGAELLAVVRREASHLESEIMAIPVAHERRAMAQATLIPFAREAVIAMKQLGFATAIWTNNDRVVADHGEVEIGSYPKWFDPSYKTKVTFDGTREAAVEAAHAQLLALLPPEALARA